MRADDDLARARRALRRVDAELDPVRLRAMAAEPGRSGTDLFPPAEDTEFRVEILRPGQRPVLPRRRVTAWALAAAVALLCGVGVGTATLWPEPGGTVPGSDVPAPPAPETSPEPAPDGPKPDDTPTTSPRECLTPRPGPSAAPGESTDAPPSAACHPTPVPSDPAGRSEP